MVVRAWPRDPGAMNETTVEQPAAKRLERSRSDRMLAGVSGGLARYFDIHPAFYRVGFVVLTLIGGAGVLIYVAAALVIPDEGEEDSIAAKALRERRDRPWPLVGLALIAIAALVLLSRVSIWPRGDAAWILLLVGGIIVLQLSHRPRPEAAAGEAEGTEQTVPAAPTARPSPWRWPKRIAIGLATAFGIALAFVLVAAAIFAAVFHVHVGNGVGDRTYDVTVLSDLRSEYKLGIGDLRVDMRDVQLPVGVTHVRMRVDVGRLVLLVPRNAALRVRTDADVGSVDLLGRSTDGREIDRSVDEAGRRVLDLDAHVGAGSLHVERAVR
jgi:phage shock protein PspC (stress-responsive transcriptional regulator)